MRTRADVAALIDHTLLKPEATRADVAALVAEAVDLGCGAVCVSPSLIPEEVPDELRVATVIGFPSGAHSAVVKASEAAMATVEGAEELDMVVNLALLRSGDHAAVEEEIFAVRRAAPVATLKVILETAALTEDQILLGCLAAESAGADFVKTSTGFHPAGGATVEAVDAMARTVGGRLGIKASGGIRDAATAQAMLDAGATRLGLSASRAVLDGFPA